MPEARAPSTSLRRFKVHSYSTVLQVLFERAALNFSLWHVHTLAALFDLAASSKFGSTLDPVRAVESLAALPHANLPLPLSPSLAVGTTHSIFIHDGLARARVCKSTTMSATTMAL